MENTPLVNTEKTIVIRKYSNEKIYAYLFILLVLQIFSTAYLILIAKFASDINLFNLNTTDTNEYINKFKSIVDYVCHNMVDCSKI